MAKSKKFDSTPDITENWPLLHRSYIKKLTFNSPRSPHILFQKQDFHIQLKGGHQIRRCQKDLYEITLSFKVLVMDEDEDEIHLQIRAQIAGLIQFRAPPNARDDMDSPSMWFHFVSLLYPLCRETIDTLLLRGGFHGFMPIDIKSLMEQMIAGDSQEDEEDNLDNPIVH